jgi:cytochrome b561
MDSNARTPVRAVAAWHYSRVAVALHWLIAALILTLLPLGWYMLSIEKDPNSGWYFSLHKSLGLTVAGLIVLRILWRATHRPARLPDSVPAWEAKLSTLVQLLLYACMVVMPLAGFLGASYGTHPTQFFGIALPVWATPNHDRSEWFFSIHGVTAWVLVVLIGLHVLGGLKHLLMDKDGVFQRMLFG